MHKSLKQTKIPNANTAKNPWMQKEDQEFVVVSRPHNKHCYTSVETRKEQRNE